jgi:hypothetical protein
MSRLKQIPYPCEHANIHPPLSTIKGTAGTITDHPQPLVFKHYRSAHAAAFKPVIAPMTITDHQGDTREQAHALLPKTLPSNPDLATVIEAWATLPESVRRLILKLVHANLKSFE